MKSLSEAHNALEKARVFYRQYIEQAAALAGGMEPLSLRLGKDGSTINQVLRRNSLSALRRLAEEIGDWKASK